jgi:hypothetical protein
MAKDVGSDGAIQQRRSSINHPLYSSSFPLDGGRLGQGCRRESSTTMGNLHNPSPLPLQRFLRAQPKPPTGERCELCGAEIPERHSHVVNVEKRGLLCACRPCYLLFNPTGAAGGHYKAVPERYLYLPGIILNEAQWDELQIPVGIAFFFFNSSLGRMLIFYPSPAGATESLLPLETWGEWVRRNATLASLAADVEALLVHHVKHSGHFNSFIVPIDACYELVGRIRRRWKGFDGGDEAWRDINDFFAALHERSEEVKGAGETFP